MKLTLSLLYSYLFRWAKSRDLPARDRLIPQYLTEKYTLFLKQGKLWKSKQDPHIHCLKGTVWVTQEGNFKDVILESGESFSWDKKGLVIVEALSEATVDVISNRYIPLVSLRDGF